MTLTPQTPYSAIVLGATGNVGGCIVDLLIHNPLCKGITVVTRRQTNVFLHPKVSEVVVNMDRLTHDLAPHIQEIDIAFVAFGVGKGSATMPESEVRRIEIEIPHSFCRAAKAAGARVCAVMSAAGASPASRLQYPRILGEKEQAAASVHFDFLGLYRPAVILGNSNTPSALNAVMPYLQWAMPSRYRSIHKHEIAHAMVARSEQAFYAPHSPAVAILEYKEMAPYFPRP